SRQRVIEIAISRFSDGGVAHHWESLCHPERRIPAYIVKLTGIDDDLIAVAPRFESLADAVVELIADAVVVGHNVEFDLGFLNAEWKRVGRAPVVNDRVDTLALASRIVPGLRKPTLRAVAERLGVESATKNRHRAGPDARVTGAVAVALIEQAWAAGFR